MVGATCFRSTVLHNACHFGLDTPFVGTTDFVWHATYLGRVKGSSSRGGAAVACCDPTASFFSFVACREHRSTEPGGRRAPRCTHKYSTYTARVEACVPCEEFVKTLSKQAKVIVMYVRENIYGDVCLSTCRRDGLISRDRVNSSEPRVQAEVSKNVLTECRLDKVPCPKCANSRPAAVEYAR